MSRRNLLVRTNSPSSYLEGDIFQTDTGSDTASIRILEFLGLAAERSVMNKELKYPYELARLNDAGGDISKRWCIDFYCWDVAKNKLVRKRKWIAASFKTKPQRLTEAKRLIKAINKLLLDGYHLGTTSVKIKPRNQMSWTEAFDWVYEHREPSIRKRSVQTLELVRRELKVWIRSKDLYGIPLEYVRHQHCDEFMQWLRKKRNLANATYNNYLSFLKLNFNYLVRQDILMKSPAAKLQPLKIDEPSNTPFPEEIKSQLLSNYPEELKIMAQYIYYTFIRPGELRKLQVKHVLEKTIFIPGHISKTGKSAHVLITPAMEQLLQDLGVRSYPAHYFWITHDGKPGEQPVSPNFYTSRHLAVRKELHLPKEYTLYCWKHTGVTDLYQQTKDIAFVARQCRHSSLDMTKHYLRGLGQLLEYPEQEVLPNLGLSHS